MPQITLKALAEALMTFKAASIVTIETKTVPAMKKTDNPYHGNLVKITRVNGMINWKYVNSVNNQRVREGKEADFEAEPRAWGIRLPSCPLVAHRDRLYLELKVERVFFTEYRTLAGDAVDAEEVRPFLRQESEGRQNLDKKVILRDYLLNNIREITWAGETYQIIEEVPQEATIP